jgi:Zn-dependent alcohol dehydrogenase
LRGVIWDGSDIYLTDALDVREIRPDEVRVRVMAAGLCHSDLACTNGTLQVPTPLVMGHEAAGVIESVGVDVTKVTPGDHVVLSTLGQCGRCNACERGQPTFCRQTLGGFEQTFHVAGQPAFRFANTSAFSEYTVVKENQAIKIDQSVPFDVASILSCAVLTGAGAVWNTAKVQPGERVAVIGLGGVGLAATQAAAIAQASKVIAVDGNPRKYKVSTECGATDFRVAEGAAAAEQIRDVSPDGVDVAIVCAWPTELMLAGIDSLDWGGRCIIVASPPPGELLPIDVNRLIYVDRSIMGSRYGSSNPEVDIPFIVEMYLQGRFNLDAMISGRAPLSDVVNQFHTLAAGAEGRIVISVDSVPG